MLTQVAVYFFLVDDVLRRLKSRGLPLSFVHYVVTIATFRSLNHTSKHKVRDGTVVIRLKWSKCRGSRCDSSIPLAGRPQGAIPNLHHYDRKFVDLPIRVVHPQVSNLVGNRSKVKVTCIEMVTGAMMICPYKRRNCTKHKSKRNSRQKQCCNTNKARSSKLSISIP